MWQLSEAVDGMAEACRALGVPVVGGNVSLYNESRGRDIDPTPIVGVVGLIDRLEVAPPVATLVPDGVLVLLGGRVSRPLSLAGSLWADVVHGHRGGDLPELDLEEVEALVALLVDLVADRLLVGAHDVSDGGLAVCLAELCATSALGVEIVGVADASTLLSEQGGRVVVVCETDVEASLVARRANEEGVEHQVIGLVSGDRLRVEGLLDLHVAELTAAWKDALPNLLG
jgi:phosphoribosylformylglycinamidine synthase